MYLIINLGLKSIRGIVFNTDGLQIYSKSFPVHTSLFNDKVEQNSSEWVELLITILDEIRVNTNLSEKIKFITATTSSSCILGIDEKFDPLTKVVMVSDKRSERELETIKNSKAFKSIINKGLTCSTSSLIPKALWFKNHQKDIFKSVRYWMGAGEMINLYFTGKVFTDPLNAGKAFHDGQQYCKDDLEAVGIQPESLPLVYDIGFQQPVLPALVKRFNFHKDCRFILTTYDAICSVLGSSNGMNDNACDVSGTITSVRIMHDKPLLHHKSPLLSQNISYIGKYLIGASNNLGGGIIEWYKQAFFDSVNDDVYFQMDNQSQQSRVGAGGIIFLPYLLGERAPFVNPNATASFFGINRSSTRKDFTRAVFESTAYVTRGLVDLIEDAGYPINSVTVSGGLSRFDLINQIKADVCNKPVYVVDNFESTSIGAFLLMTLSNNGIEGFEQKLHEIVKIRKIIQPSKKNHTLYNKYYRLFKELNERLDPIYLKHRTVSGFSTSYENEIVRNL